jgi:class 3 adenylate cyclase
VRAGLELVSAVGALKTHAPLRTRVGIATGLVVVGDLIGSGASQEQTGQYDFTRLHLLGWCNMFPL